MHTSAMDTGFSKQVQGKDCEYTLEQVEALHDKLKTISKAFNENVGTSKSSSSDEAIRAYELMWFEEVPDSVAKLLTSKLVDLRMVPVVHRYLQEILSELVNQLRDFRWEFVSGRCQLLERIFFCDR